MAARFIVFFCIIAAVLLGLYCFPYKERGISERWFQLYLSGYAHLVGALLSPIDASVVVAGNVLRGRFSMAIIKTCDAMEINILLVSAIAAFPASLRRKLVVLPVALALLVAANIGRLVILYLVGIHLPGVFDRLHFEVFPLLMMAAAVLVFFGAVRVMTPGVIVPDGEPHVP